MYLVEKIWGYITPLALECTPQCKQTQNSSQTLINPHSSPGKKKATLDQSQPTERETDVEMQSLTQDHIASSSREGI